MAHAREEQDWCREDPQTRERLPHEYVCTYEDMSGERYRCKHCTSSYYLDYDEMK